MEQEAVEYMLFLKKNTTELRKLGSDWGLTEDEINGCITEALLQVNVSSEIDVNSKKNMARKIWSHILFLVKIPIYTLLFMVGLLVLVTIVCTLHEPTDKFFTRKLAPHGYSIFRFIRLATLPLHRIANVTSYYDSECMIDNPFYIDPSSDCSGCVSVKQVKEFQAEDFDSSKVGNYITFMRPVLIKNALSNPVTYKDLRENYLENRLAFDEGLHKFESSNPNFSSPWDFFVDDLSELMNTSAGVHVNWQSRKVKTSVALRKLFPRPAFLPEKIEISLEKHVLIDSSETPTYELPFISSDAVVYTLASGHRRVLVKPVNQCVEKCKSQLVIMEPGDSLLVSEGTWRIFIAGKGQDVAVGYVMSVVT